MGIQLYLSTIYYLTINRFAYTSNGSVYFDTTAFKTKHDYAKLEPWAADNTTLVAEGEGTFYISSIDCYSCLHVDRNVERGTG